MSKRNEEPGPVTRVAGCAAALVVVVGLPAGCVYGFVQWTNRPLHQTAESMDDYSTLCQGRPIPGAAEYTPGSGPHPVAVFEDVRNAEATSLSRVPLNVDRADDPFNPAAPGDVQLVACTERTDTGEEVATCEFTGESAPMRSATVEVRVYEARTAEEVGEPVEMVGEDTDCPYMVTFEGSPKLFTIPSEDQYTSALGSLVNG
ncbi:hypothetical protein HNR12_000875 [Streptomonospora nanhaiensis]|uniref:Uncharacterized protein n=1 Tax=Streptomonospora nanhaiensis TaxID=1323731 RepID=A0A853BGJ5_9ACTN|nr:hypothetical protein [Streptomonospora nanhaiensis]NYI94598.1 hypothetical protein [Streptomonospora nanhaiensis]